MAGFWLIAAKAAGFGAIICFMFWSLYKDWLSLPIFVKMTKKQQYNLFLLSLVFTFLLALSGLCGPMYIEYLKLTSGANQTKPVLISIRHESARLDADFSAKYRVLQEIKSAVGVDGLAELTVPLQAQTINEIKITMPCYVQVTTGPFALVDGERITIEMKKVISPKPDPIPPTAYPYPKNIIPPDYWPSEAALAAYDSPTNPEKFVFEYENDTNGLLHLLLFNFARFADGKDPWRILHSDPCEGIKKYSGFRESCGLFGIIVLKSDATSPSFLGVVNMYGKPVTRLTIQQTEKGFYRIVE